jgi:hypothetical protein
VLRVVGTVTGVPFELPVSAAPGRDGLVVLPGGADTKRWWRNLGRPAPVAVLSGGTWSEATGVVLHAGDVRFDEAVCAYLERFPRVVVPEGTPVVLLVWKSPARRGDDTNRD